MAVPNATATVVGGPLTLTAAAPSASVLCTDTGTYDPAATARQWEVNAEPVPTADGPVETIEFCGPGTFPVLLNVTNADGNDDSVAVNVVVTDGYEAPDYIDGTSRIRPSQLPWEFRDAQTATPGLPSSNAVYHARTFGSVLPADDQVNVVHEGAGQFVDLS